MGRAMSDDHKHHMHSGHHGMHHKDHHNGHHMMHGMGSAQGMPELTQEQQENIHMLSAGVQLTILALLIAAFVYGYYERQRRRRIAAENGGFPARTGTMRTGLFECIATPSVCFPASFFTPILAAFNRAEVDGRDCHAKVRQPMSYNGNIQVPGVVTSRRDGAS